MASKPLRPCHHPGCPELTRDGWCPKHKPKQAPRRESAAWHSWYSLPVWTEDLRPVQLLHLAYAGKQSFQSNEQNGIEYVNYTLLGYETQWSQEDSYKLLLPSERKRGLRIKRELKVFLRGDTAAQAAFYTSLRNVGGLNANEIRALEDMGKIPGGDSYYASWNYGPLDQWARLSVLRAMGKAGTEPPKEGGFGDG